ncbi:MAG: putative DNA binding domain-containing protein [Clostridiales bacterium]|nr:putative DNA binding domain-containing protein [Clostridiales bacterium]
MTWSELLDEIFKGEKIDMECKLAEKAIPQSVYETYSSFANSKGGNIVLGVEEDKSKTDPKERFILRGVSDPERLREDFWNTINSQKVNENILVDDDVYVIQNGDIAVLVIHVPRADYTARPVYKGENPYKGTFKRNHEGDYHAKEYEVRAMIRDQSTEGNDGTILEGYTIDDIDAVTLKKYRVMFNTDHPDHVWRSLSDQDFLEMLGGYRKNRRDKAEGLTVAGLLMFGTGLAIRNEFDNILMDYREEKGPDASVRWTDRVTYDGTWENNLFNFFMKVSPKLTEDLKRPFVLKNMQREDDTPLHKAIREAFVNLIIHSDYRMDAGVLKIVKNSDGFIFTNPGSLKLPKEQIYRGGNSKARNPRMQSMLRLVGFGDNAGSGFPDILRVWADKGWPQPELEEDTVMNQVTLTLKITERTGSEWADRSADERKSADRPADRSADERKSADRPAEATSRILDLLSPRQKEILELMERDKLYSRQDIADALGIKKSRTGQLLNELVTLDLLVAVGATRYRRYVKK